MQIKETIKHYPVFEISGYDLPNINFIEQENNQHSKRIEVTDVSKEFYKQWNLYGKQIQDFIVDPKLKTNCEEIGVSWFGRNEKFRWDNNYLPKILIDSPGFFMDPHIDNRVVFAILIINLQDNPEGTGTQMLSPFGKTAKTIDEVVYQSPTQKGTGILMFNNWNTWHKIENKTDSNRFIAYQTITIDHLNLEN